MKKENIIFDVFVEIPKNTRNKYEFDEKEKIIRLSRYITTPLSYPIDYGYITKTLCIDGDPLDALIFLTDSTLTPCLVKARPIGVLILDDNYIKDDKIICVPIYDPNYNNIKNIKEISDYKKKEIEYFFKNYKKFENKKVIIKKWDSVNKAIEIYKKSLNRYNKNKKIK
ncbi:inorganic diphosphatase [Candidatus Shikimatogenerans silvanidophilus]|uniref:inorganic diphosphatase n=1 Tax=Candidatus Shikimatogenerans silvanidophilus TaxID=2782547 RepID=UPI001BA5B881|nr:inorganic diphosphatase [Candidatus Shikimatogenerans silvanidophilus]